MTQESLDFIKHLSERPWSDYTAADYSIEQWHAACLIHQHEGPPTSKNQCKLPVKTPNGAVNRNGVHAAAAALAGARGGVNASSNEKSSAAKALIRYYHQMDEEPPPSLLKHSNIEDLLEHFGTKGMKWGVRKARSGVKVSSDFKKTAPHRGKRPSQLTNKQLKAVNERLNLEQNYRRMNPNKIQQGHMVAKGILGIIGTAGTIFALANSPHGKATISAGKKFLQAQKLQRAAITSARLAKKTGQLKLF